MSSANTAITFEERIGIVRDHFERKGYRVHSGLQFGCELVLYADDPNRVHSDFCVHIVPPGGRLDMRTIQTLVRSMPELHKTLILASVRKAANESYAVDELAVATEHAPFRHKNNKGVGEQIKPTRGDDGKPADASNKADRGEGEEPEESNAKNVIR